MFLMIGINDKKEDLGFAQPSVCSVCGKYCRLEVFMTYTVLSLFLIPLFKWNRRYYVRTGCCGTLYELDSETGNAIRRGEKPELDLSALKPLYVSSVKRCVHCGFETGEDFEFCPRCGNRF